MKFITQLTLALFGLIAYGQTVSTITDGIFYDGLGQDSQSNIYCSNYAGTQVYKYDPGTDAVSLFADGFTTPNGIGITPDDTIYICEATANRISVYDTGANLITQYTGLNNPTGIKYDQTSGNLLWVSYNQSAIYSLDPDSGASTLLHEGMPLNGPSGITFIDGQTYISNYNNRKIFRFEADQSLTEIAQLPAGAASGNFCGFLSSSSTDLFATQLGEHRIYKIDPITTEVSPYAGSTRGSTDGALSEATFDFPNGILVDRSSGRIYVSEGGSSNLRIISDPLLNVQSNELDTIKVFPNPADKQISIESNKAPLEQLVIYDLNGRIVKKLNPRNKRVQIDISELAAGEYLIKIRSSEGIKTAKFLVK